MEAKTTTRQLNFIGYVLARKVSKIIQNLSRNLVLKLLYGSCNLQYFIKIKKLTVIPDLFCFKCFALITNSKNKISVRVLHIIQTDQVIYFDGIDFKFY